MKSGELIILLWYYLLNAVYCMNYNGNSFTTIGNYTKTAEENNLGQLASKSTQIL